MAKLKDVFAALEKGAGIIITAINQEKLDLAAAIEKAKADQQAGAEADLDSLLQRVDDFGVSIAASVSALVPTIATPTAAPAAAEPVAEPVNIPVSKDLGNTEIPIEITTTPEAIGLDGAPSLELKE